MKKNLVRSEVWGLFRDLGLEPRRRDDRSFQTESVPGVVIVSHVHTSEQYVYFIDSECWRPFLKDDVLYRIGGPMSFATVICGALPSAFSIVGDTVAVGDVLEAHGFQWDPDQLVWWTTDRDVFEKVIREIGATRKDDTLALVSNRQR